MSEIRQLARAARCLSNVWLAIAPAPVFEASVLFASVEEQFQAVRQAAERIDKANGLKLVLAVPRLYAHLGTEIQVFRNVIARLDRELIPDPVSRIEGLAFFPSFSRSKRNSARSPLIGKRRSSRLRPTPSCWKMSTSVRSRSSFTGIGSHAESDRHVSTSWRYHRIRQGRTRRLHIPMSGIGLSVPAMR